MEEISRELIDRYGEDREKMKILEELNELSAEIYRDINHGEPDRRKILEERTDVELMLKMIDEIYSYSEMSREDVGEEKREDREEVFRQIKEE